VQTLNRSPLRDFVGVDATLQSGPEAIEIRQRCCRDFAGRFPHDFTRRLFLCHTFSW
jgi:hypothetical protein